MYDIDMQCHIAIQWATDYGCLTQWMDAIINAGHESLYEQYLAGSIEDQDNMGEFFVCMPTWSDTRDGMDYWSEVSERWQLYLYALLEIDYGP